MKYEGKRPDWWIKIADTDGLGYAIKDYSGQGFVMISANVVTKVARVVSPKVEEMMPPSLTVSASSPSTTQVAPPKCKTFKKKTAAKHSKPASSRSSTGGKMSVEQKIISALAELLALHISSPPRVQVAFFSGYSNVKSAGFAKALSMLKTKGYIEYPDKKSVRLSAAGIAKAGRLADLPTSNAAVHERIKKLLKPTMVKVFDTLSSGAVRTRREVADATGYTNEKSAGYAKALSTMSSLGILEYPKDPTDSKKKLVQLTEIAFPFGRPSISSTPNHAVMVDNVPSSDSAALVSDGMMETDTNSSDYGCSV